MRRTRGSALIACALCLLAALALAAPAHAIAPEPPRSPNAESIATAYWIMLAVAAALVVAVNLGLIAAAGRFRARRGRRATRVAAGRGAMRLPLGALSALAIAVFALGVVITVDAREVEESGPDGLEATQARTAQVGIGGLPEADPLAEPPEGEEPAATAPLEIGVIGQRWVWRFEYPGGQPGQQLFSYGELVVPVDTTVVLDVSSIDVAHTWWVPALGGQVEAIPGSTSRTWFKAEEEGRYAGRSTIFSGTGFPSLRAWVRVVSVPEYLDHVEQLEQELRDAQEAIGEEQGGAEVAPGDDEGADEGGTEADR